MGVVLYTFRSDISLYNLLPGAAAGFLATVSLLVSMLIVWRLLPGWETYQLPPRVITGKISKNVGLENPLDEKEMVGLNVLSHFGYGTISGALYALFEQRLPMHSALKGAVTGSAIWLGS